MKTETIGLIIGGLVPALCFTLANLGVKISNEQGLSLGYYVLLVGMGVLSVGLAIWLVWPDRSFSSSGAVFALGTGIGWSFGMICVSYAITNFHTPMGQLTPLFNMNTLFTVLLALWIFSEWQQVKVPQLLIGSVLIVVGGTLVARA